MVTPISLFLLSSRKQMKYKHSRSDIVVHQRMVVTFYVTKENQNSEKKYAKNYE